MTRSLFILALVAATSTTALADEPLPKPKELNVNVFRNPSIGLDVTKNIRAFAAPNDGPQYMRHCGVESSSS